MIRRPLRSAFLLSFLLAAALGADPAFAASGAAPMTQPQIPPAPLPPAAPAGFAVLAREPARLLVGRGPVLIEATALRAHIFRIRIGRDGHLPPDKSWAVSAENRAARLNPSNPSESSSLKPSDRFALENAGAVLRINPRTGAVSMRLKEGGPALEDVSAPFEPLGDGFRLIKKLGPETHIFGLGDKNAPLEKRGYVHQNWATDAYGFSERQEPLYKDIPFFMAVEKGLASGLFLDNPYRSVFDFGVDSPDQMRFGADGGSIDYYLFAGPNPADVIRQYAKLTGLPPLPPKWAFGYHQSRYSYGSQKEVEALAARFKKENLPLDAIWLDIGYQDHNRPFTLNRTAFPKFESLIANLKKDGVHVVAITDLHIAQTSPGIAYAPYQTGLANGDQTFVHTAEGGIYVGKVWPGKAVFPNFTDKTVRGWWGGLYAAPHLAAVDGFWNDMNEPSVFDGPKGTMPLNAVHHINEDSMGERDAAHREIHNLFGMLNARATFEGLEKLRPNLRPFVMTRASYAGGQRYGMTWTGDNTSSYSALALSTPQLLSLGISGWPFAGDNLGGFGGSPPPDLLTKWMQLGMFNPIADNHTDHGTRQQEPWVDGPQHLALRRAAIETRYRLMPYIYTLAEEASRTGAPMMRPLFYHYPDTAAEIPLDLIAKGEFLWGPDLLVALPPFPEQVGDWDVILPPGDWYDYASGLKVTNARPASIIGNSGSAVTLGGRSLPHALTETPSLARLPVFARAGAVIPHAPLVRHTSQTPEGPLELAVYSGPSLRGSLYEDDGETLNYRKGLFFRQNYSGHVSEKDGSGVLVLEAPHGKFKPWFTEIRVVVYGVKTPARVFLNGSRLPAARLHPDKNRASLSVTIPASGRDSVLHWEKEEKPVQTALSGKSLQTGQTP